MPANPIQRTINRARNRLTFASALHWLGISLLFGVGVCVVMVILRNAFNWGLPWWSYLLVGGAAVLAAIALAFIRRPTFVHAAAVLDDQLGLKDRIGTSLFAQRLVDSDPLAQSVVRDAEQAASHARVSQATPIKPNKVWGWVPVAGAVLVVMIVFLGSGKPADWLGLGQKRDQQKQNQVEAERQRDNVVEVKNLIKDFDANPTDPDNQQLQTRQLMNELAELSQRDLSNPEMRKQTVARLSNVKDKLEKKKQIKEAEFHSMQSRMSKLDAGQNGPANDLADAMRRGDFDSAAAELDRLAKQIQQGDMSKKDKQALQNQLNNMKKQLKKMHKRAQQQQKQAQQQMQKQLQQAGMSAQQASKTAKQFSSGQMSKQQLQKKLQQQMRKQGQSKQQAKQQARKQANKMAKQRQQSQQSARAGQSAGGLASSLGQMASSMSRSGQSRPGQSGQGQSSAQQSAWSAKQQLNQMAKMRHQLNQMSKAQNQLQQTMQGMKQGGRRGGQNGGPGGGGGRKKNAGYTKNQPKGGGQGGQKAGTGVAGNPYGRYRKMNNYQAQYQGDIKEGKGRVIASWTNDGQSNVGEANVAFDKTVTSARDQAEQAVTEDRVPRRYHETVKDYFRQLPETAEQASKAPAAPR